MEIGMRKGKRKAIHLPLRIAAKSDGSAIAKSLYGERVIATIEQASGLGDGEYWLVIAPGMDLGDAAFLESLESDGRLLSAKFAGGRFRRIEIVLDNRGRAHNLEDGLGYSVRVIPWKKFFEEYERRSIPVGGGKRSEPEEAGRARLRYIEEMAHCNRGRVLDAATGMKDYLLPIAKKCSLTCGNISLAMLSRTREWLGSGKSSFVAYDVESGLPFKNECFDLIVCDAVLEYINEPKRVLDAIARALRKKGELLLLEPIKATTDVEEFYPQDLWEVAIWRPLNDAGFNAGAMEKTLGVNGLKEIERRTISFEYSIYRDERFQQDVVRFSKL